MSLYKLFRYALEKWSGRWGTGDGTVNDTNDLKINFTFILKYPIPRPPLSLKHNFFLKIKDYNFLF